MKTSSNTLAAALLCLAFLSTGFAEDAHQGMKDHLMFKDGKVTMVMGGKSMAADQEVALTNGGKVALDGTVTMKDGTTMKLKDGEMIGMDGQMMKHLAK